MRALDALPTAIIRLLFNMILDVVGRMAYIFHLHETALCHAVRTPTGRCNDTFRSDKTVNDAWSFRVLCAVSVPI
jgi:hypothetical protein